MILTIDIGNSNICFGVYEGKNALFTARAKTDPLRTETEYAVLLSRQDLAGGAFRVGLAAALHRSRYR